jgi:hypothetical protein
MKNNDNANANGKALLRIGLPACLPVFVFVLPAGVCLSQHPLPKKSKNKQNESK